VINPVKTNQSSWPSARIASEVCNRCSFCDRSMSGSESSNQRVEVVHGFEHRPFAVVERQKLFFLLQHEFVRLMPVIQAVELAHRVARGIVVIAIVLPSPSAPASG